MLDAGQVGTEMLYYLVGSRDLDGGLMCTASHNPKAYTGAKLVERGAVALSGDAGIGDIRDAARGRASASAPGGGSRRGRRRLRRVPATAALKFIDPSAIKPLKVVLDGGNGMAGPMVGPCSSACGLELVDHLLGARRRVPRPRAEPAAAREPRVHHRQGPRGGRRPRHRLGRRRRPLLLHRRHGRVRRRRLPHRAAGRVGPRRSTRAPTSSTTSAPRARSPDIVERRRRHARTSTASATPSSRPACATRAAPSAARSPATTTSPTSTTPTPARSRRC